MKKLLLGLVAAFAFTTVAPMVARAADEAAPAEGEKKEKKGKKGGKKKAAEGEKKEGGEAK